MRWYAFSERLTHPITVFMFFTGFYLGGFDKTQEKKNPDLAEHQNATAFQKLENRVEALEESAARTRLSTMRSIQPLANVYTNKSGIIFHYE